MLRALPVAVAAVATLLAGCTSSSGPAPATSTQVQTITQTRPPTSPTVVGPVHTGPTKAADAPSCPLLSTQDAFGMGGMRLDRITVLTADGKVVGCRFYALQHPTAECPEVSCLAKENLPPANQPAIEITSTRYPTATAAHNAFVVLAEKGSNVQQAPIATGNVGLCFETDFYPKDHGTDWACTYSVGTTLVLVRTVTIRTSYNAMEIAKAVAPKF